MYKYNPVKPEKPQAKKTAIFSKETTTEVSRLILVAFSSLAY